MKHAAAFLLCASAVSAHPAVSVVRDAQGNIFYSDTRQVIRIAPDGARSIAVPGVHTHELWLDGQGALHGEHLVFHPGAAPGREWTHSVWKRSPDGAVTTLIPTRPGFLEDYRDFSFQRDSTGAMYWLRAATGKTELLRRAGNAPIEVVAAIPGTQLGWLAVLPGGQALVSDHGSLLRIARGGAITRPPRPLSPGRDQHALMSAWAAPDGSVLIADWDGAAIRRIPPSGGMETAATCPAPWRPTGGLSAPDGSLWILEADPQNNQRLRRVTPSGQFRVY